MTKLMITLLAVALAGCFFRAQGSSIEVTLNSQYTTNISEVNLVPVGTDDVYKAFVTVNTVSGNNPQTGEAQGIPQQICYWQYDGDSSYMYSQPPEGCEPLTGDYSRETVILKLTRSMSDSLFFGFVYGNTSDGATGIVATYTIPPNRIDGGVGFYPALDPTVTLLGSSLVLATVTTPPGNNPYQYKNWWGLASGSVVSNSDKQQYQVITFPDNTDNSNVVTLVFENANLAIGTTLTIAYGFAPLEQSRGNNGNAAVGIEGNFRVPNNVHTAN